LKQLIQNFKTGELYVDEVPMPGISSGMVLVENEYSLISAGTERMTVMVAQSNLLGKAKQRPDLVAQVLQNIKKEGLTATLKKVQTKLDSLKALGYSTSGKVISSMDKNALFKPGDRVACAGQDYASHAEIVSIPQNLVAKIPDNVSNEEAAFTTLGAIAMQGLRQADPKLGEKVCVIGLGLLGQITCQLLKANGCTVFGIDLSETLVKLANETAADKALNRNDANLVVACDSFTNGFGFDSVVITAAAHSNDPIELSASILKKKGKVIIVGAVKMDIPRDPHFYRKELDLRMSCSYGPGRYDVNYEENGNDYPFSYVRWTEQRNMEAFLELLSRKAIDVKPLITHVFDITDAIKAYDIVLGKTKEPHIGILLRYSANDAKKNTLTRVNNLPVKKINVGFIGAGSFAQSYLIPNVKLWGDASLDGVVTSNGMGSKNVLDKFKFNFCTSDIDELLNKQDINTVFIATPHNLHADFVTKALKAGKNIFVEKPLAINEEQLKLVIEAETKFPKPLMIGFNRRFAGISERIKSEFKNINEPLVINVRINAGFIPKDHWTQQPEVGAGRIVGEICHFIDLMQYFTDSEPVKVFAESISTDNAKITPEDNIIIVLKFSDGSIGNITYLANGDKAMPKERIEVFGAGNIGIINDFRDGTFYREGKTIALKSAGKGHKEEIIAFLNAVRDGKESPISFRSICLSTLTTFKILDSLYTGLPQQISIDV
jgi:polar amino acid transport system substrate-binding protein